MKSFPKRETKELALGISIPKKPPLNFLESSDKLFQLFNIEFDLS